MTVSIPRILAITGAIAIGSAMPAGAQQPQSSGAGASQRAMESQSQRATTGQSGTTGQGGSQQVSQQELEQYVQALMGLASFDPDFAIVTRSGRAAEVTLVDRGLTKAEIRQEIQAAGLSPQQFRRITATIHQDQQVQQRYRQLVRQRVAQAQQRQQAQAARPGQTGQGYAAGMQRGGRPGTAELRPSGTPSGGGTGTTSGQQMRRPQAQGQQARQPGMASARVSEQQLQQYVQTRQAIEQQMGWDEFVRTHNQVAGDPALQARVQQRMRAGSGAESQAGQPQSGTSGQQAPPGQEAPLPSGGALGVGPQSLSPGEEQQPPGTREPGLGPNIPRPTQ